MLNIFLDISRLLSRLSDGLLPTGVDRVGLAYIERYRPQARAILSELGLLKLMSTRQSDQAFNLLLSSPPQRGDVRKLIARALITPPSRERFDRAVTLHTSHNGMEQLRYYQAMNRRHIKTVFMVHDLIPITHAEYCRPGVDQSHRRRISTALRHADGLIVNSQDTLEALVAETRRCQLELPPTVVAHLAPGISDRKNMGSPLEHPYFVMLGTIEPRKNHWFMLHVWRRLVEQLGDRAPKLVVIGRRGWECENVIDMLERCSSIKGAVIEKSDCTDEQLRIWLQNARALLFPSFVEGYGMPLVEALVLGVPVIASHLNVFREIASDIPDYLDPLDGPGWLSCIQDYAQQDSLKRVSQLDRLASFHPPTWAEHFKKVDHFLETLFR